MKTIDEMKNQWLSPHDVCEVLKIKMQTLYNWIYQERIPCIKMGRSVRFRRSDIEKFIKKTENQ